MYAEVIVATQNSVTKQKAGRFKDRTLCTLAMPVSDSKLQPGHCGSIMVEVVSNEHIIVE